MADFNYADEAGIIALATEIRKRIPSYAVCSTPAATAAKAIDNLTGFDLRAGATIRIKFTYGNTAPNPTLNINNTGAKEIYKHGTDKPGGSAKTSWQDESVVTMTYDGTAWFMNAYAEDVTMMEGATSTTPGTSGYVPAPAAGDQDKVLQGDGTWGVSPGVKKYPVTGTVTNASGSYTHTFEDEHITPDMEVDRIELGSPEVFGDKLHFVCGNGTVTMTCSEVSGTSTIKMWCQKLIVDPTAVTSTEFDILNNRLLKVENVEINYAVSVTTSQWTLSENEYVYTWLNDRVENGSSVSVEFADNANSVDVDYIDVEQITGGVKLYAPWAPEDMMVNIKVTNARSKEIANITADMVATNAIATATDVEGALTRLNTTINGHGTDIDDLQDDVETLFNAGSKILPIITGTLNNSGYTINSGDYFEANGNLYKATATIPTNESWSSSSDALTTSALSDIHTKMGAVGNNSLQSQITTLNSNIADRFRVVSSGSLHDIIKPGIYYLTSGVTDKPTNTGGFYYCGFYGISVYGGIFVPAYDSQETPLYLTFTNNGSTWNTYSFGTKKFETTTVTGTTTQSGAINIPTADVGKTFVNAVLTSQSGFVFRRDTFYFTVADNGLNPLANTEVTIQVTWMY